MATSKTSTDGTSDNGAVRDESNTILVVPKPEKIVPYSISSSIYDQNKGALYLYGDPSSSKLALLCAGFADDHTVFQPFAKELAEQGKSLVGVMCIPGYDDRPEDNVHWTSHNKNGYTFDDWANAVRDAVKVLRAESTATNPPTFTGIFHDWGTIAGSIWMNRALEESSETGWKPTGVVYFDVLLGPNPKSPDLPPKGSVPGKSVKAMISGTMYQLLLANCFFLQRHVSSYLSCFTFLSGFAILDMLRLGPLYGYDVASIQPLYKQVNKELSLFRVIYMAYVYWNICKATFCSFFSSLFGRKNDSGTSSKTRGFKDFVLHLDWKKTPILYMYGTKKRTQFHDNASLKMLEMEEKENKSLSKVVPVEETGHFLYVQKPKVCLQTVVQFMNDTADAAAESK